MAKAAPSVPAEKLALYEKLVATVPGIERKGATVPYTSLNGHMFSYLTKEGTVALRLPAEMREAFQKKYNTQPLVQYGVVMKDWVEAPDALLSNTKALKKYFAASIAYASALKPKPTKKQSGRKS